jgi:hypothetical protein
MRWLVAIASVLLAVSAARSAEPCRLVAGSDEVVVVKLVVDDPRATVVAGASIEVDHPEKKLGVEGEGIQVPATTISGAPPGAIATANDLGDRVRIVIASAGALPTNEPLLAVHFARCTDAAAATAADFSCKVIDAADPSTNKIPLDMVRCTVALPR